MNYLIADEPDGLWGHRFDGHDAVPTRFAIDLESRSVVGAQIRSSDGTWSDASDRDRANLETSILEDNSEALEAPEDWGLSTSDFLPDWLPDPSAAPGLHR